MEEKKSYFAIIPASVRYDKNLCANAKLLYGEITALCNEKGFCWANNQYFVDLYSVDKRSVSRWLNDLIDNGYIIKNIQYAGDGKTILQRCLSLNSVSNVHRYGQNCHEGGDKNVTTPSDKNVPDNNTLLNTTINTYVSKKEAVATVSFDSILNSYSQDEKLKETIVEFIKMRKLIKKPMTNKALELLLNKLSTLASNDKDKIAIVEQSICSNWNSVYELKQDFKSQSGAFEQSGKSYNQKSAVPLASQAFNANDRKQTSESIKEYFIDVTDLDNLDV